MSDTSSELLTPAAFQVLLVLVEGPTHGYAITAEGGTAARAEANRLSLLVRAAKERGLLAGDAGAAKPRRQKERER
jgi:hypothetical protein